MTRPPDSDKVPTLAHPETSNLKTPEASPPRAQTSAQLKASEWFLMAASSALVLTASYAAWWSIPVTEAWGFVTGGVCVCVI